MSGMLSEYNEQRHSAGINNTTYLTTIFCLNCVVQTERSSCTSQNQVSVHVRQWTRYVVTAVSDLFHVPTLHIICHDRIHFKL